MSALGNSRVIDSSETEGQRQSRRYTDLACPPR
jgi:hypothetical protein